MSYTALYRKWRPASFDEVKGQDHIVKTLKNQITSGRIGHAYLLCGTRGTGKTSIAKIFARAVNCEHPTDGNPCGECALCKQIAAGASLNVVEIDAASNNGVENIRDIREQVQYPPTEGRFRVFIIDEVHMLSIGAFNALLKTLEEPPSYVIFILATTEAHKIPITILSRCQRYDFKRITVPEITARLQELTQAEQMQAEDRALRFILRGKNPQGSRILIGRLAGIQADSGQGINVIQHNVKGNALSLHILRLPPGHQVSVRSLSRQHRVFMSCHPLDHRRNCQLRLIFPVRKQLDFQIQI